MEWIKRNSIAKKLIASFKETPQTKLILFGAEIKDSSFSCGITNFVDPQTLDQKPKKSN